MYKTIKHVHSSWGFLKGQNVQSDVPVLQVINFNYLDFFDLTGNIHNIHCMSFCRNDLNHWVVIS